MDVSALFEIEREFGSYYKVWDDDVFGDDDEEDEADEEQGTTSSASDLVITDTDIVTSPVEGDFSVSTTGSLSTSRRRRGSLSLILNPPPGGHGVLPPAPLPWPPSFCPEI